MARTSRSPPNRGSRKTTSSQTSVAACVQQTVSRRRCEHRGEPVRVGPYTVYAGGTMDLEREDLGKADILVPLTQTMPVGEFGQVYVILAAPLRDFGGVPDGWGDFLSKKIIPLLAAKKRLLAFCMGSHGRTGTFLGSLIALLEPDTKDPIAAVRLRHCPEAVETLEQARAIFALRDEDLPEKYQREFIALRTRAIVHAKGESK